MNYLDGFSGYGGFHLALEEAGFKFDKVYFSEVDKHAIANYKYNFPNSIYAGPIQSINRTTIPEGIDIFSFGWPCQDNSIAGKRKGQSGGTRSGLLSEAVRVIDEFKPRHFIAENVPGLLSVNKGVDYIEAIRLLCVFNEGCPQYDIEMQLLNTKWFLPQNRERLFFVGHLRGTGCRQIFPIGKNDCRVDEGAGEAASVRTLTGGGKGSMTKKHSYDMVIVDQRGRNPENSSDRTPGAPTEQRLEENKEGLSNTLTSVAKDNLVMIKSNTKAGFEEVNEGDSINFSVPNSSTPRGRVGKGVAQTLDTACNQGVITHYGHKDKNPTMHEISPTLKAQSHGHEPMVITNTNMNGETFENDFAGTIRANASHNYQTVNRIRRLTEIECERLQGLPDNHTKYGIYDERPKRNDLILREQNPELWAYHTKQIEIGNITLREISATQRYKMCGNGVTKHTVLALARKLFKMNYE